MALHGGETTHLWPNCSFRDFASIRIGSARVNHNAEFCTFGLNPKISPYHPTWVLDISKNTYNLCTKNKIFLTSSVYHYIDVIMTTVASQITSLTVVYSTVYSDVDQRKHQRSASLAFVWGIHRDRWIPRTKGQLRGKCFHLMTSSCAWHIVAQCLSRLAGWFNKRSGKILSPVWRQAITWGNGDLLVTALLG